MISWLHTYSLLVKHNHYESEQFIPSSKCNIEMKMCSNKFNTELMKISFHESQVDIICNWFRGSSKKNLQLVQKKVSLTSPKCSLKIFFIQNVVAINLVQRIWHVTNPGTANATGDGSEKHVTNVSSLSASRKNAACFSGQILFKLTKRTFFILRM